MSRATGDRGGSGAVERLSLAEGTCLALVVSGHRHGWALVRELAPDGSIGRIWSLSRPLTYRAIDQLVDRGLLERAGTAPGGGKARTLVEPTAAGRRAGRRWVRTPVTHLRDVRTELLVKLALAERLGLDRVAILRAQQRALDPIISAIAARPPSDPVDVWRLESSAAVRRFLDAAIDLLASADA
jgi:PadR family transcriptional regulator AphA